MWNPRLRRFTLNRAAEEVLGISTAEANEIDLMSAVYPSAGYRADAVEYMHSLQPGFREWVVRSKRMTSECSCVGGTHIEASGRALNRLEPTSWLTR